MHLFSKKAAVLIGGLVLALVILAPPQVIQGSEWDLLTIFSTDHQIQVPGAVLEPNTKYSMKLLDLQGTRNVVQVFNEDRTHLLTTFIAISAYRLEPADKTLFTFYETEPGYAKPIDKWFYPGRLNGLEFIYPKEQAAEIAMHLGGRQVVQTAATPAAPAETTEREAETAANITPAPEAPTEEVAPTEQEITREKPSEVPSTVEEQKPAEQPAMTEKEPAKTLPKTAGELPLVGLIGMLCFGFGLGLKVLSAKS